MKNSLSNLWFKYLTSHFLIYNTSWEDPEIDRNLINLHPTSDLLMITSAGDNAFDYLLDCPSSIDCIDINPYQNALLNLKYALFEFGSFEKLNSMFLTGKTKHYQSIFNDIKHLLNPHSRKFWSSNIHWFSADKGFYNSGLTGYFAGVLNFLIDIKGLRSAVNSIITETSPDKRARIFETEIAPALWQGFSQHFWKSKLILSLAGVPDTQRSSITDLNEYMKTTLWNLFVKQGVNKNYFWKLYLEGNYTETCRPNYLKKENYVLIRSQLHNLSHSTGTVTEFLNTSSKKYSHFVLLDHQDWLVGNGTDQLEKEWISILKSAKPKAKILMRSVHKNTEFLPPFVQSKVKPVPVSKDYLLQNDRVGTYPSTFLLEVDV